MQNKTTTTKKSDIKRKWHLIDAKGKILGRLSVEVAQLLIGKFKPFYVPYLDCGEYVIVINSKEIKVTGKKAEQKEYQHYSGYPGGLKKKTYQRVMLENPNRIIKESVAGMLPKNKLRASMLKRLYVYPENKHPYEDKLK